MCYCVAVLWCRVDVLCDVGTVFEYVNILFDTLCFDMLYCITITPAG